nr:hypothetical protein BSM_32990 [uncultured archaeon]
MLVLYKLNPHNVRKINTYHANVIFLPQFGHFGAHLFTFVISASRGLSFSARQNATQLRLSSNMCLIVRWASVVNRGEL